MRRYNSLNSSDDGEGIDITDNPIREADETTPFSEVQYEDGRKHKKTLCLVFVLFFGGLVCLL